MENGEKKREREKKIKNKKEKERKKSERHRFDVSFNSFWRNLLPQSNWFGNCASP